MNPSNDIGSPIRLHRIAHARTGDKGNHSNISLFAYQQAYYPILVDQLTEQRVADLFADRRPTAVKRFLLPKLHGLNFVLENVLDGGVNESLNLDMHGKALSFMLLSLLVAVPVGLLPQSLETACQPQLFPDMVKTDTERLGV